ncbi:MAG: DUF333 domain-containing protein [Leptospiraceae bacterium]|nr:DUF333 domain-containing protein [Leptospiraceae bacterium]MCP5497929.1 DUF333 domain-containing protein [Leptospiraceae bacterium]
MITKIVILSLIIPFFIVCGREREIKPKENWNTTPAYQHCIKNNGKIRFEDKPGGTYGFCVFPDGSECDEWQFFRGECKPGDNKKEPKSKT